MEKIIELAAIFGGSELKSPSENNNKFSCSFEIGSPIVPSKPELLSTISFLPDRDTIEVECIWENQENSVLYGYSEDKAEGFLSDIKSKREQWENTDTFSLNISINKGRYEGVASVYSLENFVSFWESNEIIKSYKRIQELVSDVSTLRVYGLDNSFSSNNLLFTPFSNVEKHQDNYLRDELHIKRDMVGHFSDMSSLSFVPEDFHFSTCELIPKYLIELFVKLKLVASLIYLCDFTKVSDEEKIHLSINGYRLFSRSLSGGEIVFTEESSSEYFSIYR